MVSKSWKPPFDVNINLHLVNMKHKLYFTTVCEKWENSFKAQFELSQLKNSQKTFFSNYVLNFQKQFASFIVSAWLKAQFDF